MEVLVVAGTPTRQRALTDVLYREKMHCVVCKTAAEARRASLCRPYDLFVICGGLSDEHGNELAIDIAEENCCGGVYIDDGLRIEQIESDLNYCGIVALAQPVAVPDLISAVRLVCASTTRVRRLKEKNDELSAKLCDIKYISRAKITLMRSFGFSELQAHKYIEERAMEKRISRRKVAIDILNNNIEIINDSEE